MWQKFNPNPLGRNVGDCSVRAIAAAFDISWNRAYRDLTARGYDLKDMPSGNSVWGSLLKLSNYERVAIPSECPDCYTVEDFAKDNRKGIFVLGFGEHVATMKDGVLYDSWDSTKEIPQYFWYRR